MRKPKKPVRREPPAWGVYRLKSSPAGFRRPRLCRGREGRDRGGDQGTQHQTGRSVAVIRATTRMTTRHFPPPWTVEETDACFVVKDHCGLSLAYVFSRRSPARRAAAKLLTRDEARRIAANIAKLPVLLAR